MTSSRAASRRGKIFRSGAATGHTRSRLSGRMVKAPRSKSGSKSSTSVADMRIERIEIRVTDLKTRLQRQRSTGPYDTGAPGTLLGKPVLVKIYAEGVVGYGQIRPLAPHHAMPDTYATMIAMIREIWGPRLIGRRIFDTEAIHRLFAS